MTEEVRARPVSCDDCVFLAEIDTEKCNVEVCTNPAYADYSRMGRQIHRWADTCRAFEALCGASARGFQQKPPRAPKKPSLFARLFDRGR